jgi:hypothetical protein
LDYYTEVQDLSYLLNQLDTENKFTKRLTNLNKALGDLIEEFGMIGFYTLNIEDKESVLKLSQIIDKANGYVFGSGQGDHESILASVATTMPGYYRDLADIQERYLSENWTHEETGNIIEHENAHDED